MANTNRSFMHRALDLSLKGKGKTHPNPLVGCVIVKNGRTIGEGYHAAYGAQHAEMAALRKAGSQARGATLYLTLEPCTHWGKTPPCAPHVVQSGIKKAYIAMKDPNPLVTGRGLAYLRRKGISVHLGLEKDRAAQINKPFITWKTRQRPYTILKMAMTLDGKIASKTGDSHWVSHPASRAWVHQLRSESDAVLVGANTALYDNPQLTAHGKGRNPLRVVLDPHFKTGSQLRLFNDRKAKTLLVTGVSLKNRSLKTLQNKGIQILRKSLKYGKFELRDIVRYISKINVSQLLIEGGGDTAWNFIKQKLVDEVVIFIAPKLAGGRKAKTWLEGEGFGTIRQALPVKNWTIQPLGTDLMVRGSL